MRECTASPTPRPLASGLTPLSMLLLATMSNRNRHTMQFIQTKEGRHACMPVSIRVLRKLIQEDVFDYQTMIATLANYFFYRCCLG
jgi:hypothetical protein